MRERLQHIRKLAFVPPGWTDPRVLLAFSYSELGQEEKARAEAAEVMRLNSNFSLEVGRQAWPHEDQAVLERYLAALRKAGLK